MANGGIPRYDPNWSEGVQEMELVPQGDYVTYDEYKDAVDALQRRIDGLQQAVRKAPDVLSEEL